MYRTSWRYGRLFGHTLWGKMADLNVELRRQAGRRRQSLVADQVDRVACSFFNIYPEMIRFFGWG